MTYEETLHYLYTRVPVFQHSGASAYKPGLGTSLSLDKYLAYPHKAYKTIHVAGTNGKGSTSHLLAAVLQKSGYKVGLYTSPHLVDFRERIRVDGKMIDKQYVVDFIEKHRSYRTYAEKCGTFHIYSHGARLAQIVLKMFIVFPETSVSGVYTSCPIVQMIVTQNG